MFKTSPEMEIRVERIIRMLAELPLGATLTYKELSEAVGNGGTERIALIKARSKFERETGIRLATVRSVGIKKLSGEDIAGIGVEARRAIGKKAKKQSKRLTGLRYNDIGQADQSRIDAERSLLAAIASISGAEPKKLEEGTRTGPMLPAQVFTALKKDE